MSFPIVPDLVAYIPSRHCPRGSISPLLSPVIPRGPFTGSS
ncbi:hypothetical protein [Rickettsia felis]|nr:hypothetical protein [Rickettsia felis]